MGARQKAVGSRDRIVIDAEELIMAIQNHEREPEYFLDRSTGEIVLVADEGIVGEDAEGLASLIEEYPDRFLSIEPTESSVKWQIMADFIEALPSGGIRERLTRAVQHGKPFRRFKDELLSYPDLRQDWFAFEYREMLELARDWLKAEGIKADLKQREFRET